MGKVQIKKKSMFIDMTAMSDVTVLLLTFFMLTGNFIKKERFRKRTFCRFLSNRVARFL